MIVRLWRATAHPEGARRYEEHFSHKVLPLLEDIPGYLGACLLRRDDGDRVDIQVLTRWESMDSVRSFAGTNPETAVVEPAAQAVLLDYDSTVTHHTVAVESPAP